MPRRNSLLRVQLVFKSSTVLMFIWPVGTYWIKHRPRGFPQLAAIGFEREHETLANRSIDASSQELRSDEFWNTEPKAARAGREQTLRYRVSF